MRGHLHVDPAKALVVQPLLNHRCPCHAGSHRVAPYSPRTVLAGDVGGQRGQPALGGAVGAAAKTTHHGERRRHVDDRRAGRHMRQHLARQPERRAQHHRKEVVQRLVVGLMQRLGATQAGVVDQKVDPTPAVDRGGHDARGGVVVGQIDRNGGDTVRIVDRRCQRREPALIAAGSHDRHPHVREFRRAAKPDATARACHDRYPHVTRLPSSALHATGA
jgi:hypothetical protein